jgi:hypothetical protein
LELGASAVEMRRLRTEHLRQGRQAGGSRWRDVCFSHNAGSVTRLRMSRRRDVRTNRNGWGGGLCHIASSGSGHPGGHPQRARSSRARCRARRWAARRFSRSISHWRLRHWRQTLRLGVSVGALRHWEQVLTVVVVMRLPSP